MEERYQGATELLKALAHPVRLRIVHGLLREGCRNVSCMEQATGMSQSCISQHLQKLRAVGVVTGQRTGNEVYYTVSSPDAARVVAALMDEEAAEYVL